MSNFPGGSAWAMARDIAEGYVMLSERSLSRLERIELEQLGFELDRLLRDLRGEVVPLDDAVALQGRQRKMLRLNQSLVIVRASQLRKKR